MSSKQANHGGDDGDDNLKYIGSDIEDVFSFFLQFDCCLLFFRAPFVCWRFVSLSFSHFTDIKIRLLFIAKP